MKKDSSSTKLLREEYSDEVRYYSSESPPALVIVSGFLGSGKTTLMLRAANLLKSVGVRAGVITNDQAGALVDTQFLNAEGLPVEEVSGGCFCCRFSEFVASADRLLARERPQVILAEPVGSCTDLRATILAPLEKFYQGRFTIAPLTVLIDPMRAAQLLRSEPDSSDADPDFLYLFEKQIAEADLLYYSKVDSRDTFPEIKNRQVKKLSAFSGEGVAGWLREVLSGKDHFDQRVLEIDYRRYAEAEAALGWLNWRATISLDQPLAPASVVGPLLEDIDRRLTEKNALIAHLKISSQTDTGYIKAGITRNSEEPTIEGSLTASPAALHLVLINLRARAEPDLLSEVVGSAASNLPGQIQVHQHESIRPATPVPEHRLS